MTPMNDLLNLSISRLRAAYLDGSLSPAQLMADIRAAMPEGDPDHIWIHLLTEAQTAPWLEALAGQDPATLLGAMLRRMRSTTLGSEAIFLSFFFSWSVMRKLDNRSSRFCTKLASISNRDTMLLLYL